MTNKNFIKELSQRLDCTTREAQDMVHSLIDVMNEEFMAGEPFMIPGFGTFEVKKRMERIIVNPSTHQRMLVPPKLVLGFKPVPSIKEKLKNGGEENG
ncbi:MAG: HU family DNA-binding protein [Prevotella sp.]|nr:HU family DNA-binding protein [Prevotella sp.]